MLLALPMRVRNVLSAVLNDQKKKKAGAELSAELLLSGSGLCLGCKNYFWVLYVRQYMLPFFYCPLINPRPYVRFVRGRYLLLLLPTAQLTTTHKLRWPA